MGPLLKVELKKAFTNKMFFICLAVGIVITMVSIAQNLSSYWAAEVQNLMVAEQGFEKNPMHPMFTPYTNWIGNDYQFPMTSLFYMLLPLLAGLAYGWSYCTERKSGYAAQMVSRSRKKSQYFLAKYIATFLAGGAAVAIPLVLNFIVICCFIPAYTPDNFYWLYYAMNSHFLRGLFFNTPLLFVCCIILLDFIFAGLFAAACVALAFFVKNKFAVILLPFLGVLAVQYLQDNVLGTITDSIAISPMDFLRGYAMNAVLGLPILIWLILLLVFTLGITWIKGAKDDVL